MSKEPKAIKKRAASYEKPLKVNAKFKDVIRLAVGASASVKKTVKKKNK